jgi:hypothetical protein
MDATPSRTGAKRGAKPGPKRNAVQKAADLALMEQLALRGTSQAQIASAIGDKHGRKISRQMVSYTLLKLAKSWEEAAAESLRATRAKAFRKLDLTEAEAWAAWDRSRGGKEVGNPAFLKTILDVHDRRARLAGLDVQRTEISGPNGSPVQLEAASPLAPLTDKDKVELLRRHLARLESTVREREKTEAPAAPAG